MEQVYLRPPRTMQELWACLPEGTSAQLIENQIFMSPAPTSPHQKVVGKIFSQIFFFVEENELGEAFIAPFDVHITVGNIYQPDIVFISTHQLPQLKREGFYGAPVVVIEVVSKGSEKLDRGIKKDVYEKNGVQEYWIVDPDTKHAEGFLLQNGRFVTIETSTGSLSFKSLELTVKF